MSPTNQTPSNVSKGVPTDEVGNTVQDAVDTASINTEKIVCEKNKKDGTWTISAYTG